jgi:hypothetical protein
VSGDGKKTKLFRDLPQYQVCVCVVEFSRCNQLIVSEIGQWISQKFFAKLLIKQVVMQQEKF